MDELWRALERYLEESADLDSKESEYTGYSPSYHLDYWIRRKEEAKKEVDAALRAVIVKEVEATLATLRRPPND